jgi:hypothetical protein
MKKIMFNDKFGLTKAVLEGRKTMTRRMIKQPPYENFDIAFPAPGVAFDEKHPLSGAFCWVNKDNPEEHTEWIRPQYKIGEEVAVAQAYINIFSYEFFTPEQENGLIKEVEKLSTGCHNKMFVKAELMPHRIRITNVKLQNLRDISDKDCLKEGVVECVREIGGADVKKYYPSQRHADATRKIGWGIVDDSPKTAFARLIDWVSGDATWEKNPYVFVYEFELVKGGNKKSKL